jgi:hypothetical protein
VQDGTVPVFIGPWNDSMGKELLYWVPFVRWASTTYALAAERVIVLSGTGLREWYGSIAHRFLDARTLFSASEFKHWASRTVPQSEQNPKQTVMSPFDREIVERAARAFDLSDYHVLHPYLLFRVLHRLNRDLALDRLREVLRHELVDPAIRLHVDGLPASFVVVSGEFTAALPRTEENERLLAEVVAQVAAMDEVVRLDGLPLFRQMQALACARAFVGGYGDLAILAAFCGTPSTVYHSKRLPDEQFDRLQAAAASGGWAPVTLERARRFKGVRLPEDVHA